MALCDENDINVFLAPNDIQVNAGDDVDEKNDAERIIRAYLAGRVDAVTMAGWTSPSLTPAIVRAIAGRMCAALRYRTRYAENTTEVNTYAKQLYDEAMALLNGVASGAIDIPDISGGATISTDQTLTRGNYYPNDEAPVEEQPKFTWQRVF